MDTVLVGGIGVLVLMFVVWKVHSRLEEAELSPTLKRLVSYALILIIIAAVGFVINWHRSNWMASL
jgi:predicted PurR-regulated permease PerM